MPAVSTAKFVIGANSFYNQLRGSSCFSAMDSVGLTFDEPIPHCKAAVIDLVSPLHTFTLLPYRYLPLKAREGRTQFDNGSGPVIYSEFSCSFVHPLSLDLIGPPPEGCETGLECRYGDEHG